MSKEQRSGGRRLKSGRISRKAQWNQIAANFLRSELEVADALIRVAETTSNCEAALRNLRNASLALEAVEKFGKTLEPDFPERSAFRDVYVALCQRLTSLRTRLDD